MSNPDPSPTSAAEADGESAPLLLDFGQQKAKAVKRLRKGTGKLFDEVLGTIEELKAVGTISSAAQTVIVVVQEKPTVTSPFSMLIK